LSDTAKVVGEILAGGHDGRVLQIIEAIQVRMRQGSTQTYWRIRYDDLEVTQQSVTVGEMRTACDLLSAARGERVMMLDVHPEAEAGDFIAVLAAVLQHRKNVPFVEAERQIAAVPMGDLMACVDLYEVAPAPKD
jgi:hypothetical protein